MTDLVVTPPVVTPPVVTPPVVTPPAAWYADAPQELQGVLTRKVAADKLSDPKQVALHMAASYSAAEKMIGGGLENVVRFPKEANDPGWSNVWEKLGVPKEAKDYDFAAVTKYADGTAIESSLLDSIRLNAKTNNLTQAQAVSLAKETVGLIDKRSDTIKTERQAALEQQKTALRTAWGKDYDAKFFAAKNTALALGVKAEVIAALEASLGYDGVMDHFYQISKRTGEDRFVSGDGSRQDMLSKQEAETRLSELKKDQKWAERYLAGDVEARKQAHALAVIISGDDTEESNRRALAASRTRL